MERRVAGGKIKKITVRKFTDTSCQWSFRSLQPEKIGEIYVEIFYFCKHFGKTNLKRYDRETRCEYLIINLSNGQRTKHHYLQLRRRQS